MRRRSWTVATLAAAADLDVEQVLVALWSEGIEYPTEPTHRIRSEDVGQAERATGLSSSREKRIAYWLVELGLSRDELVDKLRELGLELPPRAQTMPKGAIRRLRRSMGSGAPRTEDDASPELLPEMPPFEWVPEGTNKRCEYLTADELVQVHLALTEDFADTDDPISPNGVKSQALLESAAGRPKTGFGEAVKYPTVESAAAALLHSIVQNHPFHNGNKRTALVSTMVFLDRHNLVIEASQDELFRFMIRVAAHTLLEPGYRYDQVADREVAAICSWIIKKTRPIRREERAVTWRELQRKLRQYDCVVTQDRGEKVLITREVQGRRRLLGGYRTDVLESHYINTGDGREVPRNVIKRIRQDLQLDADHGIDAQVFYGGQKDPDFFVIEYSQLLKRLARV